MPEFCYQTLLFLGTGSVAMHAAARVGVDPALYHGFGKAAMRQQGLFAIAAHGGAIISSLLEIFRVAQLVMCP
jgi:hypothetical protein